MTVIDAYRLLAREHGLRAPICPLVLGKLADKVGVEQAHREIAALVDADLAVAMSLKLHQCRPIAESDLPSPVVAKLHEARG